MNIDEKARLFVERLQAVMDRAESADKSNPACCETVSARELRVLRTVGGNECCIMSAIAGAIRCSLSSVTGLIDRLVEKKLVRRDRSIEDRRVVQVELTEAGRKLHAAAIEGRAALARDMLQALSSAEQETLLALLAKVKDRASADRKTA